MGQDTPIQFVSRFVLLIAATVQGITPDARDLAALRALNLICPTLQDDRGSQEEDECANDVCEPIRTSQSLRFHRLALEGALLGRVANEPRQQTLPGNPGRYTYRQNNDGRHEGLIHSLGRFLC
jgi:hypothetical protein